MPRTILAEILLSDRRAGAAPVRRGVLAKLGTVWCIALLSLGLTAAQAQEGTLDTPSGDIILKVRGNISRTNVDDMTVLDEAMLGALPVAVLETRTVVTDGVKRFEGFLMRDLLEYVGAEGETVTAIALNDYIIDIPMEDFENFDVLVATHMHGQRLLPSDKGPLWIVYPRDDHSELQDIRYDYRWVWQLIELEVK